MEQMCHHANVSHFKILPRKEDKGSGNLAKSALFFKVRVIFRQDVVSLLIYGRIGMVSDNIFFPSYYSFGM